jgi:hypothetical protein
MRTHPYAYVRSSRPALRFDMQYAKPDPVHSMVLRQACSEPRNRVASLAR